MLALMDVLQAPCFLSQFDGVKDVVRCVEKNYNRLTTLFLTINWMILPHHFADAFIPPGGAVPRMCCE
jgi:hypothetical protein